MLWGLAQITPHHRSGHLIPYSFGNLADQQQLGKRGEEGSREGGPSLRLGPLLSKGLLPPDFFCFLYLLLPNLNYGTFNGHETEYLEYQQKTHVHQLTMRMVSKQGT